MFSSVLNSDLAINVSIEYARKFDNRIKKYMFWQETNYTVLIDNTEMIDQRLKYTYENPVRA